MDLLEFQGSWNSSPCRGHDSFARQVSRFPGNCWNTHRHTNTHGSFLKDFTQSKKNEFQGVLFQNKWCLNIYFSFGRYIYRKRLLTGTLPVNNSLLTGIVPVNNSLLTYLNDPLVSNTSKLKGKTWSCNPSCSNQQHFDIRFTVVPKSLVWATPSLAERKIKLL